jgi:hypothetical protein
MASYAEGEQALYTYVRVAHHPPMPQERIPICAFLRQQWNSKTIRIANVKFKGGIQSMNHEQLLLARCEDFGAIYMCRCGQYHVHLPGVSVHFSEKSFELLVQMIQEAKESLDTLNIHLKVKKKDHLHIVKK